MKLIMINDDAHTFDFVMECLQAKLSYPKSQFQSILALIDTAGKCAIVENDDKESLEELKEYFTKQGLIVEIEE